MAGPETMAIQRSWTSARVMGQECSVDIVKLLRLDGLGI